MSETGVERERERCERVLMRDSCPLRKLDAKQKQLTRLEDQLHKLEVQATDKVRPSNLQCIAHRGNKGLGLLILAPIRRCGQGDSLAHTSTNQKKQKSYLVCQFQEENKEIALGTSKLNYLDPRITVAWCKKWDVPIEKIYNKTQRQKFAWAMDMVDEDFVFTDMED